MAAMYYIGTRPHANGRYYIHADNCPLLPSPQKRIYLGTFLSPEEALEEGKKYFNSACCCTYCLPGDYIKAEEAGLAVTLETCDSLTDDRIKITFEIALFCGVN